MERAGGSEEIQPSGLTGPEPTTVVVKVMMSSLGSVGLAPVARVPGAAEPLMTAAGAPPEETLRLSMW